MLAHMSRADRDANRKAARFAHLHSHVLRDARILTMGCGICGHLRGILPTFLQNDFIPGDWLVQKRCRLSGSLCSG